MSSLAINAIIRQKREEERRRAYDYKMQQEKDFRASQMGGVPDADTLYYNILVKNNKSGYDNDNGASTNVPLVFNETRSQPYINCADNYYMSVLRFDVNSNSLPVLIVEPVAGSAISSRSFATVYQFYVGFNTSPITYRWTPASAVNTIPAPNVAPKNYTDNEYFYCYSYDYFLSTLNAQIAPSYIALGLTPPFFEVVDDVLRFVMANTTYNNTTGRHFGMNESLYALFNSFSFVFNNGIRYINDVPNQTGLDRIQVKGGTITAPTNYAARFWNAEYSPFAIWNPVESIVFSTNLLPVVPEMVSKPLIYGEIQDNSIIPVPNNTKPNPAFPYFGSPTNYAISNANTINVLTDFVSPINGANPYRPNISFSPVAEFRLADLYDSKPIRDLDIKVLWKDFLGKYHTFYLLSGGTASIKIMFRKKDFDY